MPVGLGVFCPGLGEIPRGVGKDLRCGPLGRKSWAFARYRSIKVQSTTGITSHTGHNG